MLETKPRVINDYIFKKIFSKTGNESVLKDFLIGVLNIPIEKVETKAEVSLEKQLEENKLGRLYKRKKDNSNKHIRLRTI